MVLSLRQTGGIVLLDKPQGLTSNQALSRVKRLLGIKKAGHTGTLDPLATGLLVLCFGHATRVSGQLLDANKAYQARVHLGVVTDTDDAEGALIERRSIEGLTESAVQSVLKTFRGDIEQVPPVYSALKHQGERLYAMARRGEVVERPARPVTIHQLMARDFDLSHPEAPGFTLEVVCSKGTYIRSLVRDIGQALGSGAHLSALRRTASQPFALDQAMTLEAMEQMSAEEIKAIWLPVEQALPHWPQVSLDDDQVVAFRQGRAVRLLAPLESLTADESVCVMAGGECIGLADHQAGMIQPKAVFV